MRMNNGAQTNHYLFTFTIPVVILFMIHDMYTNHDTDVNMHHVTHVYLEHIHDTNNWQ